MESKVVKSSDGEKHNKVPNTPESDEWPSLVKNASEVVLKSKRVNSVVTTGPSAYNSPKGYGNKKPM